MTLKDIYVMMTKAQEEDDPIPPSILADMLEDAGISPDKASSLRLKGVYYQSPQYVQADYESLWPDFSWTRASGSDEVYRCIDFSLKAGDKWENLYLVLRHPLRDME